MGSGARTILVGAIALGAVGFFIVGPSDNSETYVRSPVPLQPKAATIIFGGDMMFDRSIRSVMEEKGEDFVFSCIDDVLRGADLVVANLEGPITSNESKSVGTTPGGEFNYTFTFSSSTAALLFAHGIRAVNIGNNHILNFGPQGVKETVEVLRAAHVEYFGDPRETTVTHEDIRGIKLALINYNEFIDQGRASTTLEQIALGRAKGYLPIVYTHWGDEYAPANAKQKNLAHVFIDAGAEIVIGSHPHVVQEHEIFRGKYIYYSLGNFIFDQYWNEDVRSGLLLKVTLDANGVRSIQEIPVHLERDRRTCPQSES